MHVLLQFFVLLFEMWNNVLWIGYTGSYFLMLNRDGVQLPAPVLEKLRTGAGHAGTETQSVPEHFEGNLVIFRKCAGF